MARLPYDQVVLFDGKPDAMLAIKAAHEWSCRVRAWQLKARITTAANPLTVRIEAGWP